MQPPPRAMIHARITGRTVAVACAGALALGSLALSPASAATATWDPKTAGLEFLPDPSVNAEITVAQVAAGQQTGSGDEFGALRSFTAAGQAVAYANPLRSTDDIAWGPAGDVIGGPLHADGATAGSATGETLVIHNTTGAAQWSPFGDSVTRPATAVGGFRSAATWVGGGGVEEFGPVQATDPGPGVVLPNGSGTVVEVGATPSRDLGLLNATFPRISNSALNDPVTAPATLGYGTLDARGAAVSADGTLAFIGGTGASTALYVDEGAGAKKVTDLGADCDGLRPAFAPSGTALAYLKPVGGSCASTELRTVAQATGSFVGGTDALVATSPAGSHYESTTWRAKTPAVKGERLFGNDRMATGVAVSKWGWGDGSAHAVVLASAGSFPDSIVGTPLAGQLGVPLLITPTGGLDSRVLAEIKRVLQPEGYVYIVGGPGAVSSGVEDALHTNGIGTHRLAGADRFATSVAVAEELDWLWEGSGEPRPTAFLADGTNFPDALVSGPAATVHLAPVLLSYGSAAPAVVRNYVTNHPNITRVNAIGGSAVTAGAAFGSKTTGVAGADRYETSQKVAARFFAGAGRIGYATGLNFPDALTGGALMSAMWQPVMLTRDTSVPTSVADQASRYRPATDVVLVFGGPDVVADPVLAGVSAAAGTQSAYFGWDVPLVPNPKLPAPTAATDGARSSLSTSSGERLHELGDARTPRPKRTH